MIKGILLNFYFMKKYISGHWNDPDANYTMQGGYFRFINILSALDEPVSIFEYVYLILLDFIKF